MPDILDLWLVRVWRWFNIRSWCDQHPNNRFSPVFRGVSIRGCGWAIGILTTLDKTKEPK